MCPYTYIKGDCVEKLASRSRGVWTKVNVTKVAAPFPFKVKIV